MEIEKEKPFLQLSGCSTPLSFSWVEQQALVNTASPRGVSISFLPVKILLILQGPVQVPSVRGLP